MKTKTLKDLATQAETRTLDRVEAESPSITDNARRRFSVFHSELAALAAEHNLPVLDAEIEDLAAEFAFGTPKPAPEPQIAQETPVSDENPA